MSNEINYVGGAKLLKATISNGDQYGDGAGYNASSRGVNYNAWMQDIAQSHHFTVELKEMSPKFKVLPYDTFIPVKTINLNSTSFENMTIPVSIFGDFPILNRRRVSNISLSCYDRDDNRLEKALRNWEQACFPLNRYVAYLEDVAQEFIYVGYNVKGQKTYEQRLFVIPTGTMSVSRDTSANEAKMLNFSLMAVGDGQSCATGAGGSLDIIEARETVQAEIRGRFDNDRAIFVPLENNQ